jgi:uncharacterized protein YkwD
MSAVVHGPLTPAGPSDPLYGLTDRLPLPSASPAQPIPAAAAQLLDMTNLARTQAGEPPLTLDGKLSGVAEDHSVEMFRLAYFAHDSPTRGSPTDRARAAGVPFRDLAENIAYAPSVAAAFTGLMNSSEHRQNLLSADFSRVGIGVVESGLWGYMVTQDFAD